MPIPRPVPRFVLAIALLLLAGRGASQQLAHLEADSPHASYVEVDFPFFTQTVDATEFGEAPVEGNLVPRGIVVPVGDGYFGCFDPDLLRWALFWKANEEGEYLTMDGMAPGSYRVPNRKAPPGQANLPRPLGTPLWATAPLPGFTAAYEPDFEDPRERGGADETEVGLGPIPEEMGRFSGIRLCADGVRIEYTIAGAPVKERLESTGNSIRRIVEVGPRKSPIVFATGAGQDDWVGFPPSDEPTFHQFTIYGDGRHSVGSATSFPPDSAPERRWNESLTLPSPDPGEALPAAETAPFVYDDLPLPLPNPWRRNLRPTGIDFYPDGLAALATFDGDVWIVDGLAEGSPAATWSRFASGLHEPKSLCIVEGVIHVFDRNGIVRLHDESGNGEADWYENFSNVVAQSAETREFAMSLFAAADGGFYIAKGGQIGTRVGKRNGTIIKISPDGRSYEVLATGLRQPYLGYDPESGTLLSSDQQGNWKPASPVYRVEPGHYYGFQPEIHKDEAVHPAPIDPPAMWIPHAVNPSSAEFLWLKGPANMGALDDSLVLIGFNRPELLKIYLDPEDRYAAATSILSGFPIAPLKGRVHPVDGRLYLSGFKIWGSSAERLEGLLRVRPGPGPSWLPSDLAVESRGVTIAFDREIDVEGALDPSRYAADRWNYRQTHQYGSGNFRLDGEPGQEVLGVASVKVSEDRRRIFLGIPDMRPSDTLRVTYRIPYPESTEVASVYFGVHQLESTDLLTLGFADNEVDLTPPAALAAGEMAVEPSIALGKEVSLQYGCLACHATGDGPLDQLLAAGGDASLVVGPPWTGLWGTRRRFVDGSRLDRVDADYLRESIIDPAARVPEGYEIEKTGVGMPSYLGVLKEHEIESIILYIESLAESPTGG